MFIVRTARPDEMGTVISLVREIFEKFVRPDLEPGGWEKLMEYIDVDAALGRQADHAMFVAELEDEVVGVLEIRQARHVALLVVDERHFGKGVAKALVRQAVEFCKAGNPEVDAVTVHSSRYAIEIYRRLGFRAVGEEMVVDGICFTPMSLPLGGES